jgi:enamine deaminase RidA (YjgF/YER057c/UK114 family)
MTMLVEGRLEQLGLELPAPVKPLGSYCTFVRAAQLAFLSGHVPLRDGQIAYTGKVGTDLTVEQAQAAARYTALCCLATLKANLDSLDQVKQVIRLTGYVLSAPGFSQQPAVLNAASDLLAAVFGAAGVHVRSAVGVSELPGNATVEIELTVEIASNET